MTNQPHITLKNVDGQFISLTNTGGNKAFYFMGAMRKAGVTCHLLNGQPHGVAAVRIADLGVLRDHADDAGISMGWGR